MRDYEYQLLDAVADNPTVTQAGLAAQLGVAVGSINWYIKRIVAKGYVKATRMQRTWLKYHLTPDGCSSAGTSYSRIYGTITCGLLEVT